VHYIRGDLLPIKSNISILVLAITMLAGAALAAEEMNEYTVNLATNDTLGPYLVNQTGFALYYFMNDAPGNGTSTCMGKCSEIWPPFYAENISVPLDLNASDFMDATRTDGIEQTAYKGWPLYFYSKDTKAGDVNGEGVNNVWFAATSFPPVGP
jgi:predicted lipoprotein with Yx(FWY)xxD motif